MKLIDRDKVVAKIEKVRNWFIDHDYRQSSDLLDNLLVDIQQEQPKVDLDEEIKRMYLKHRQYGGNKNILVVLNGLQFSDIAKHFYELGLNARKGKLGNKILNN